MSESTHAQTDEGGIQYLRGLEPDDWKRIQEAVSAFKTLTKLKEGNDVVVQEFAIKGKSGTESKPLAHRYRISIYLVDDKVDWPRNHGEYLTVNGVISTLNNLTAVWNLLKNYRVKKAVEQKKRISHLNRMSEVSEKEIASW